MHKKVLVVGANFGNKGAQSMLFTTVGEIKKRINECDIYFAGAEPFDVQKYAFKHVYFTPKTQKIALKDSLPLFTVVQCFLKDCIKWIIGRRTNLWKYMDTRNLLPRIDLIIDVSGFSLGDKWSIEIQESYLNNIRLAKKHNIPIYMMPQSFGSFHYTAKEMSLKDEIRELMRYPRIVYAREREGFELLKSEFQLQNVVLSTDLVLQNTDVSMDSIYRNKVEFNIPKIFIHNSVGIVPNKQCFRHGDMEKNLVLYRDIISELISKGKDVYVFRHSGEDLEICKSIVDCFRREERVHLITNDFSCFEYDVFIRNFEFIICSRYHGIVHAYRNSIPCISLGWAVKYRELAENVEQSQYAFDITDVTCTNEVVIKGMIHLMQHIPEEKEKIRKRVRCIQENDCFRCISDWAKENE